MSKGTTPASDQSPSSTPPSSRARRHPPPPAIHISASHSHLLDSTSSTPSQNTGHSAFPSTPSSTLTQAAVPRAHRDGQSAIVTFSATATGNLSTPSPATQTMNVSFQHAHSQLRGIRLELWTLRQQATGLLTSMPADVHMAWGEVFELVLDMDSIIGYIKACKLRTICSAVGLWTYNVEELCFHLLGSNNAAKLRDLLEAGTIAIIRQHWHTLTALTSADLIQGSPLRPSAMSTVSSRDNRSQLSSVAEDPMAEVEDTECGESLRSSHRYLPSASTPLAPTTDDAAAIRSNGRDTRGEHEETESEERGRTEQRHNLSLQLGNALNTEYNKRRASLHESVKELEAVINRHMQDLDRTTSKPVKYGARRMQRALDKFLELLGASSRSASPSPVATPVAEGPQMGSRTPAPPPLHPPAAASSGAPPHSPAPWDPPAPFTAAPAGPLEQILPLKSSGIYRAVGPQALPSPSVRVGGHHLAVPEPSHQSASTSTTSRENQVDGGISAPLSFTEIRRLLEAVLASDDPAAAVDCQTWASMYHRLIGWCLFASVRPDIPPPNVPGPSTSVGSYTAYIGCIHEHHIKLALPCTDPVPIPVEISLSELFLRLETLQEARAVDLLSAISCVVLGEDPSGANIATLSSSQQEHSVGASGLDPEGVSSSDRKGKGRVVTEDLED
ncbi:hypothetical protein FA13DRAFT_1711828 [Coprinellus micaceus]|uniref:Uncharacterized protein n=1 Tax=Coprinellus micaceus TaxID=71717 RepID=A0A4Y7T3K5_COPMI|nr:hypothetical protein FA13DRAFT_1711828 [Coprinellus micaceus]